MQNIFNLFLFLEMIIFETDKDKKVEFSLSLTN
jgi:hypothetical protein